MNRVRVKIKYGEHAGEKGYMDGGALGIKFVPGKRYAVELDNGLRDYFVQSVIEIIDDEKN